MEKRKMTPTESPQVHETNVETLPLFDGPPYLNTPLVPALYHVALLPAEAPESTLLGFCGLRHRCADLDAAAPAHGFTITDARPQP
jgi:hypothetical protein